MQPPPPCPFLNFCEQILPHHQASGQAPSSQRSPGRRAASVDVDGLPSALHLEPFLPLADVAKLHWGRMSGKTENKDEAIVFASAAGFYDFSGGEFTPLKLVQTSETTKLMLQLEEKNT